MYKYGGENSKDGMIKWLKKYIYLIVMFLDFCQEFFNNDYKVNLGWFDAFHNFVQ